MDTCHILSINLPLISYATSLDEVLPLPFTGASMIGRMLEDEGGGKAPILRDLDPTCTSVASEASAEGSLVVAVPGEGRMQACRWVFLGTWGHLVLLSF